MNTLALNIEEETIRNIYYRKVVSTTETMQVVLMSISPKDRDVGFEVHPNATQFIRIERGRGVAILIPPEARYESDKLEIPLSDGMAVIIPPGYSHNIINLSRQEDLKLYTIYAPPQHPQGLIEHSKID